MRKTVLAFIALLALATYLAWDPFGEVLGVPKLLLELPVLGALTYLYFARIRPELVGEVVIE